MTFTGGDKNPSRWGFCASGHSDGQRRQLVRSGGLFAHALAVLRAFQPGGFMQFRFALVLVLLLAPRAGFASAIIFAASDLGALDYGLLSAIDSGPPLFDPIRVSVDGGDWRVFRGGGTNYSGESGPLVSLTLTRDAAGAVVESRYAYDGGTFFMTFDLKDTVTGETAIGNFIAPILGLMTVVVRESDLPLDDSAVVSYRLGPGLFDGSVARLLGVSRKTRGGLVSDPWLVEGTGDYTSLTRRLDEGASEVTIEVPEPASLLLFSGAGLALLVRHRLAKRRPSLSFGSQPTP
jgi:hypothetical protein